MATVTVTTSQNLSTVVYAANDDLVINPNVTLTISATPATRIKSISGTTVGSKLFVQNTSTANMLRLGFTPATFNGSNAINYALDFQNGGTCEFDGTYITVYTGTGAANQTVFANLTVGGQTLDTINFVEVETGNGTGVYEKWAVVPVNVTNFHQSEYGYNGTNVTAGTVAITAGGVVTGTGTNFISALTTSKRFRAAGHATDYIISSTSSTTSLQLTNADGSTYTGGVIAAGATYVIRSGSAYDKFEFYSNDRGTVLFLDPLTLAITCGDGTNGKVVPNGAKVRVPNIFVTADLAQTTLAAAITGTTAAAITLTSGTDFPTANTAYSDTNSVGTLLIYDAAGKAERIGFTTRTGATISATGMTRGAYNSVAQTFANGSKVYFFPSLTGAVGAVGLRLYVNGSIIAKNVMFSPFFSLSPGGTNGVLQGKESTFENCGLSGRFNTGNPGPVSNFKLKNVLMCPESRWSNSDTSNERADLIAMNGTVHLENIFFCFGLHCYAGSGKNGFSISTTTNITKAENIKIWNVRPLNAGNAALNIQNGLKNIKFKNLTLVGQLTTQGLTNVIFDGIAHAASGSIGEVYNPTPNSVINHTQQSFNVIYRGVTNYEGAYPSYNVFFVGNTYSDYALINNKGFATFNRRGVQISTISQTNGSYTTFAYTKFSNSRFGNVTFGAELVGYGVRRIMNTMDQYNASPLSSVIGPGTLYGGEIDVQTGPNPRSATLSQTYDVQAFTVNTDSTTATGGYLCAGAFCPDEKFTGTFSGLSTSAYLDGAGRLYLATINDQVTISSKYSMKGWSSFNTAGTITQDGSSGGNVTAGVAQGCNFEFRMVNWGDDITLQSWQSLTLSNLETRRAALTGYSTTIGFNFQMRITANTNSATRYFNLVRMPGTWDTTYAPPVGYFYCQVTNLLTGSTVALSKDGGTTFTEITTASSSTVNLPIYSDYLGNTINYVVRIRKAGYAPIELSGSVLDDVTYIGNVGVTLRADQVEIVDSSGNAIYGNGTTSALVSLDYAALRIDIGNGTVSGPDLYDTVTDSAVGTTGIKYAWPLGFSGTASGFDVVVENTWKIRRKLVTDTNAAVSVFVIYGPNPALSPVDTVNGSVALSRTFTLSVDGSLNGSVLALSVDAGASWTTATSTGSVVDFSVVFTTLNGTENYILRVRKAGYTPLELSGSLTYTDATVPVAQVEVVDINGLAVYGRGAGTTTAYITVVPAALRVDIGNILVVGEDLYDYLADWQATTAGIQYDEVLQFNGTDSIILNTWKLRRDVVGSTNAMIDMIVSYGPNTALNPVDEANGSVQLFPRTVRQIGGITSAADVWDYAKSSATTAGSMGEQVAKKLLEQSKFLALK
jgi:hypothetical protein